MTNLNFKTTIMMNGGWNYIHQHDLRYLMSPAFVHLNNMSSCRPSVNRIMEGEWESGRVGEWEGGRVGRWESGRVGRWESGRVGEWEGGRVGEWEGGKVGDWETGRLGGWEQETEGGERDKAVEERENSVDSTKCS